MPVSSSPARILIVEDEPDLADILQSYLRQGGYDVRHAADGFTALERFFEDRPALVLLDLMLPRLSGMAVLQSIREAPAPLGTTPVIALTARGSQEERLQGFASGADDYVVKPYWPREVVARVRAALSRRTPVGPRVLSGLDELEVDASAREVIRRGQPIALRPAEFDLLVTLLEARGRVFSRHELLEVIRSGESWALERTVDSHITRLRAKLGIRHGIETVHGVGYRYAR